MCRESKDFMIKWVSIGPIFICSFNDWAFTKGVWSKCMMFTDNVVLVDENTQVLTSLLVGQRKVLERNV